MWRGEGWGGGGGRHWGDGWITFQGVAQARELFGRVKGGWGVWLVRALQGGRAL